MSRDDTKQRRMVFFKSLAGCVALFAGINIIFALAVAIWPPLAEMSGFVEASAEIISIVFAVMTLRSELLQTQKLEEAEFIVDLNEKFSESKACTKVFSYAIWEAHDKMLKRHENGKQTLSQEELERVRRVVNEKPEEPGQIDLSGYLTFFESIFLLLQRGVIKWDVLNELFKYRFFAGVHSDFVQKERLLRLPRNFKNIFYLEHLWMEYNGNEAGQIAGYENRLAEACAHAGKEAEYREIIDEMKKKCGMEVVMPQEDSERTAA